MHPAPFVYHRPSGLPQALDLLGCLGDDVRCLAGGQSLIPSMKLRLSQPGHLVDLAGIDALRGIEVIGRDVSIGAMTTHRQVEASPLLAARLPYLCEVAGNIADPQVRNRGTIGGSLANADPAADYPASLLALDAVVEAVGPQGGREIRAEDWPVALMATALGEGEILARVRFPLLRDGEGASYVKVLHPASRFAVVGVAAKVGVAADGRCTTCRIAVTGVGEVVQRARAAEDLLLGTAVSEEDIRAASARAAGELAVMQDDLLSEEAKRHLCSLTVRKALRQALGRVSGRREGVAASGQGKAG